MDRNGRKRTKKRKFLKIKKCRFCVDKIEYISYTDVNRLKKFVTERGKILPRRITGTCASHQRQLSNSIYRARFVALMPYIAD